MLQSLNNLESLNKPTLGKFVSEEQLNFLLGEGFEYTKLDTYSDLVSDSYKCYKKYVDSNFYSIYVYVTENGISVDLDYTCGGNSSNRTWWFTKDVNFKTSNGMFEQEVDGTVYSTYTFEEAWSEAVKYIKRYK